MRFRVLGAWFLVLGSVLGSARGAVQGSRGTAAGAVIDRILASVSGGIITLSDVNAAIELGVVNTSGAADPLQAALDQLIARSLMLAEVDRYAPPEPNAAEIDARVRALRAHPGTEERLKQAMTAGGLSDASLRGIARDDLRLEAYLSQRFASLTPAADEEVLRYYREHQNVFVRDGVQQPLAEVEAEVRRRIDASRRAALIDEWSRQLRQRADVLILPR
jgi:hypothetical protein